MANTSESRTPDSAGNAGEEQHEMSSAFDAIRHADEEGGEYWSAREMSKALQYTEWRNFSSVIHAAMTACESSEHPVAHHFVASNRMIPLGKGGKRTVEDWHLSRYACYLIVMNGDPSKPVIALGQTYFAAQTRRTELADEARRNALAGLSEEERRLLAREQVAQHNTTLADAAHDAGVITTRDFAVFQDHGYRGLYAGEGARDIAARKGLKRGQHILDYMGSEELAANLFRVTQTEAKIRRENIQGRESANQTHYQMGAIVRRVIIEEMGGTPPEELPTPPQSIRQLQAHERLLIDRERQPSLFESVDTPAGSDD